MPGTPGRAHAFALRASLWFLLGSWIGAWLCFGLVIAPIAFRVLPSIEIAGTLIGPVLDALQVYGVLAGVLLALIAKRLGRGGSLVWLALAAGALCAASQWVITPAIDAARPLAFGAGGSPEMAARFHQLHRYSVIIFCVVGGATLILLAGHVRADLGPGKGDSA